VQRIEYYTHMHTSHVHIMTSHVTHTHTPRDFTHTLTQDHHVTQLLINLTLAQVMIRSRNHTQHIHTHTHVRPVTQDDFTLLRKKSLYDKHSESTRNSCMCDNKLYAVDILSL
jgi:hypothetical protein